MLEAESQVAVVDVALGTLVAQGTLVAVAVAEVARAKAALLLLASGPSAACWAQPWALEACLEVMLMLLALGPSAASVAQP